MNKLKHEKISYQIILPKDKQKFIKDLCVINDDLKN